MNPLVEKLRAALQARTPRERWLAVLALCIGAVLGIRSIWIEPLHADARRIDLEIETQKTQVLRATQLAGDMRRLQAALAQVEALVIPGQKTDLFTLLESLATEAGLTSNQIDSVKPQPPSSNARYPETRVEVRLKGTTLEQVVKLLHKIESARLHLIVRSLRITTRGKKSQVLEVSFSVSSFERA